ncbi:MAG: Gfo/Idh/MocA family oxidoreductase [Pirellulales bacterium]|nr:Gfo/Idh/MocA family oxidoreductase [Pirellulales bacterium]
MFDAQSRREFLRRALAAGTATLGAAPLRRAIAEDTAPAAKPGSDQLRIAVIGVANRGMDNIREIQHEAIVALCDVDQRNLAAAATMFPSAKKYIDYRRLLDEGGFDAVLVATPDHSHAIPVVRALAAGHDVYCEKPLAHSVWEVRQMRELAARQKAVTQMGTQIHAGDNYRRAVEIVQAGILGDVTRVHVWHGGTVRPGQRVAQGNPPPEVDYDLWLGPAPERPFHPSHFHFNWRYWWDFGGGTLADFGCHYMDLPFWALGLRSPTTISSVGEKDYAGDNDVPGSQQVEYHFPATDKQPAVHLTWYHGQRKPEGAEQYGRGSAVLFEGTKGRLLADYSTHKLFMDDGGEPMAPAESIPNSIGHHAEWLKACRERGTTTCNFDYSGALAEAVLLGNVAYRAAPGETLAWDAERLEFADCANAAQFVRREYRKGWSLGV